MSDTQNYLSQHVPPTNKQVTPKPQTNGGNSTFAKRTFNNRSGCSPEHSRPSLPETKTLVKPFAKEQKLRKDSEAPLVVVESVCDLNDTHQFNQSFLNKIVSASSSNNRPLKLLHQFDQQDLNPVKSVTPSAGLPLRSPTREKVRKSNVMPQHRSILAGAVDYMKQYDVADEFMITPVKL